ncbi:4194_t:CDS:2, partial [Funneliformis geosporum]
VFWIHPVKTKGMIRYFRRDEGKDKFGNLQMYKTMRNVGTKKTGIILAVFIAVNCASPAFAPEGFSILRKRQTPKPNCVGDYCPEPECVDDDATKCPCVTIKCIE